VGRVRIPLPTDLPLWSCLYSQICIANSSHRNIYSSDRVASPFTTRISIHNFLRQLYISMHSRGFTKLKTSTNYDTKEVSGTPTRGPLNNQGKPAYFRKKTNANEPKNMRKINPWAHGPPNSRHSHPRAELRFVRGARCHTGKTPPRSRAGRPLG
jgi:hypothetical protein